MSERGADGRKFNGDLDQEDLLEKSSGLRSLHFGDHTRTTKEEEILHYETRMEKLFAAVIDLQNKITDLQEQNRLGQFENDLDWSLGRIVERRLKFDVDDVHSSINSWNFFFDLHGVDSDKEKFFAIVQILPDSDFKAMGYCDNFKRSYNWLVKFLQNRYEPRYKCHNMKNVDVFKIGSFLELEGMAVAAAKCPKDHLIKHFLLEPCSYEQKQEMEPYLYLSLDEFKLKLKLLINVQKSDTVLSYSNSAMEQHEMAGNIVYVKDEDFESLSSEVEVKEENAAVHLIKKTPVTEKIRNSKDKVECIKQVGLFSCSHCGRKWMSRNLTYEGSSNETGLERVCFVCRSVVTGRNVTVKQHSNASFWNLSGKVLTKPWIYETKNDQCYQCGKYGHYARDCHPWYGKNKSRYQLIDKGRPG